ncbi:MAG: DUF4340 domain-containing protein [Gammaproteobacteria bacterium]|nr:DUF4340 domain-containing protein [Gammaproteobacteria bacterium]MCW8922641.1 DUF4340 domain-containing protein [Gammaproteobacteria bacterium]
MRSHFITNFLLLLLAVSLGLFLFTDDINQNGIRPLSSIEADSINHINIQHNQREIVLQKTGAEWQLTEPVNISANQFRIKTLLNLLGTDSHAQYNTDQLELNKYGLDEARTSIHFNQARFIFGIVNPMNNLRYVMYNQQLHLIDDHVYPLLSSQIGTLVARELFPAETNISKLVLPEHTLTRNQDGLWQSNDDISSDAIVETLYQWTHKQAFAVHDYVKRDSLGEIQVFIDGSDGPINFSITDVDPWLIIARPDIKLEYHFNLEDYDALLRPGSLKQAPEDSLQVSPDEFIKAIQSE